MKKVLGFAAIALTLAQIGCATSSYKHFEHADSEVMAAMLETEQATLTLMQASASPDVAEAAQQLAQQDRVR